MRRKTFAKYALLALLVLVVLGIAGRAYYRARYPFGWSHCCDTNLMFALHWYAEDHGGRFPTGGATAEASLSLLYPKYADADLLRGKTVPLEAAEAALTRDGALGPETCGWHYVDGLTTEDDSRLALVWDKVGLGHNGEGPPGRRHAVIRIGHPREYVAAADWPAFLAEQKTLLAERKERPPVEAPR